MHSSRLRHLAHVRRTTNLSAAAGCCSLRWFALRLLAPRLSCAIRHGVLRDARDPRDEFPELLQRDQRLQWLLRHAPMVARRALSRQVEPIIRVTVWQVYHTPGDGSLAFSLILSYTRGYGGALAHPDLHFAVRPHLELSGCPSTPEAPFKCKTRLSPVKIAERRLRSRFETSNSTPRKVSKTSRNAVAIAATLASHSARTEAPACARCLKRSARSAAFRRPFRSSRVAIGRSIVALATRRSHRNPRASKLGLGAETNPHGRTVAGR